MEPSLASAFTTVTTSLVNDILLPPMSVILPLDRNMQEKFAVLKPGPDYEKTGGYTTIDQAVTDGAVILAYGCVCLWFSYLLMSIPLRCLCWKNREKLYRADWVFPFLCLATESS